MSAIKKTDQQPDSHDILVKNLRLLMYKHDVTEAELSRRTHTPQPTIHKILAGKTTDPRISTLKILADYFALSVDALYSNILPENDKQVLHGKSVPVISWDDCIKSNHPTSNLNPNNWDQWVVVEDSENTYTYGLITKPSMEPRFPRGSMLIVDPNIQPSDGDLVIVQYPETTEATLRELSIDGPHKLLFSINQSGVADKLDQTIKIIGTVTQSRFLYTPSA